MDYQDIRFEIRDGVAVMTLNRPEHRNAFCGTMAGSSAVPIRRATPTTRSARSC